MEFLNPTVSSSESPYDLLLKALSFIPISHYLLAVSSILVALLYRYLDFHILEDLFTGFKGQPVDLTFNSCSDVYNQVVSKCKILHGRYLATPWLCSPHLQTVFLGYLRAPVFNYTRQIFRTSDGGTIALDWLMNTDVKEPTIKAQDATQGDNKEPIMIVIPGLTSDSESAYVKHLAFEAAQNGWNVVVSNHRGLGGVSLTSDRFYHAGWTDDIREVVDHVHHHCSEAPLFLVGTSIGANVLVKYLGEDGANIPIVAAAAVCSPWDLLIGDRFIKRRLVQRFYDKALGLGLKGYAQLHQTTLPHVADWEGIAKTVCIRDFDTYATCFLGKFETADTFYRKCSSAPFVGSVMVPLLCVSALDDPVCSRETIPWDECWANKNVVLATTRHGGHLAYFEGLSAKNLWWVRAINEFFSVLLTSPLIHQKNELQVCSSPVTPLEFPIEVVAAYGKELETSGGGADRETGADDNEEARDATPSTVSERELSSMLAPIKKRVGQLSRQSTKSLWLLVYIAIVTTWPVMGSALLVFFLKKLGRVFSTSLPRR